MEEEEKNNGNFGRPLKFKNTEELEEMISKYFQEGCNKKTIVIGKPPKQQTIEIPVPTITGLALYLGFASRQSFYDYEERPAFSYAIKSARTFIEIHYEEMLQIGNTTGAIFALKNMGWKDKTEVTANNINYNTTLSKDEIKEISDELDNEF